MSDGGIFRYSLDDCGKMKFIDKTTVDRPMYMTIFNNKAYIILRSPFKNSKNSGVITYNIDNAGKLISPSKIKSTEGEVACHIAVDGENVYCANYISGSIICLPELLVKHEGKGIDKRRQEAPHAHYVGLTPDRKYICVADLGLDTVFIYDKQLNLYSKAKVPEGHGARHIAFSDDGKYMFCANELKSTVSAFSYADGKLDLIDTVSTLPEYFTKESTVAAIRVNNGKIYVSNRGHDSVSEFEFNGEKLNLIKTMDTKGNSPRDFNFIGKFMICTNELSNNVTVFDIERNFEFCGAYSIDAPLCIL